MIRGSLRAHPRSRGENETRSLDEGTREGSSPLTRGKQEPYFDALDAQRLIPAHAGKTRPRRGSPRGRPAHPRSRGENRHSAHRRDQSHGSSPLTRGKLTAPRTVVIVERLIPAHAGKTLGSGMIRGSLRAHPRSRGENPSLTCLPTVMVGSSPLTRGKLNTNNHQNNREGLIPAHAGKTLFVGLCAFAHRAHPRSRGENQIKRSGLSQTKGSSPLTRGKPRESGMRLATCGLIPAHAGKTIEAHSNGTVGRAHPRSRGENSLFGLRGGDRLGSSPLTRGKRPPALRGHGARRLIPAHAGKTSF